jgi:hypothetical protein
MARRTMPETPYSEGYYAGLINDRANPHHPFWSPASHIAWHLGNQAGLDVHCALVEAAYHASFPED